MPNKNSNVPYDQIPHIVINNPLLDPYHKIIMVVLFKVLKDKKIIIYTNEKISEKSSIPLRTVERKVKDLIKLGYIESIGKGHNRKILLGILFNNTASVAEFSARKGETLRHSGGDTKIFTKNKYTKGESITDLPVDKLPEPPQTDKQEYYAGMPGYEHVGLWLKQEGLL